MATILRAPVFSTLPRRPSQPADCWPNLLLSTLSLIVLPTLIGNPCVPKVSGQSDVLGTPLALLAKPAQQQPVGQNDPLDRCQPRVIPQPQDSNGPRSLLQVLTPAQLLPIGQNDPIERCQPRVVTQPQDSNGPNALLRDLPPAQLLPIGENGPDWPQPALRRGAQADALPASSLLLSATPSAGLTDWSQPVAGRRTQPEQPTRSLLQTLTPAQLLPIGANGLDLGCQPRSRAAPQADAPVNLLTSTLSPSPVVLPFLPPDWSQVRVALRAQDTTSTRWLGLSLAPVPLPFVAAPDLVQPRARAGCPADSAANLLLSTLATVQGSQPFLALDWPQPRTARGLQADAQPASSLLLSAPPPACADWTQPAIVRRAQADAQPAAGLLLSVLPPGAGIVSTVQPGAARRLQADAQGAPGLLSPAPPVSFTDWSVPSTVRRSLPDVGPNLLVSTLASQRPFVAIPDACQVRMPRSAQDTSAPNALLFIAPPISLALRHPDLTQPRRVVQPQDWTPPNVLLRTLKPGAQLPGAVVFVLDPNLQTLSLTAQDLALSVDNDGTEAQVGADDRHLTVTID